MNMVQNTNKGNEEFDPTSDGSQAPETQETKAKGLSASGPVAKKPEAIDMRTYQIPGVKDTPAGQSSLSEEAILVKEKLAKEERISFVIPLDPGEKPGAYRSVTINGYRCEIKKGVMVALPMSIAQLLIDAYQIESTVLNENEYNLANKSEDTKRALNA